jgi:hypothetical protein
MSVDGCDTFDPEDDGTKSYHLRNLSSISINMKSDGDGYDREEYDDNRDDGEEVEDRED